MGVFYGSSYIAIFNLFIWSYGITLMSGDKKYMTPKKLIINPGIIGLSVGLIVNGYAREVLSKLPMEFAVEAQKLLQVSLEGSVG